MFVQKEGACRDWVCVWVWFNLWAAGFIFRLPEHLWAQISKLGSNLTHQSTQVSPIGLFSIRTNEGGYSHIWALLQKEFYIRAATKKESFNVVTPPIHFPYLLIKRMCFELKVPLTDVMSSTISVFLFWGYVREMAIWPKQHLRTMCQQMAHTFSLCTLLMHCRFLEKQNRWRSKMHLLGVLHRSITVTLSSLFSVSCLHEPFLTIHLCWPQ